MADNVWLNTTPQNGNPPLDVVLYAELHPDVSNADQIAVSSEVDWGDGASDSFAGTIEHSWGTPVPGSDAVHTYQTDGAYTVTLHLTGAGLDVTATYTVAVTHVTLTPVQGAAPLTVNIGGTVFVQQTIY